MPIFDLIVIKKFTEIIEKIKNDIEIIFPDLKNDSFLGWQDNFDKLETVLTELKNKQKREVLSTEKLQENISDIVDRLQTVIYELEILFPNKKIRSNDEEDNKNEFLRVTGKQTLDKDQFILNQTSKQIIDNLKLVEINSITKEDGHFKEFIRSINENEKGDSFTKIFYLLQSGEKSFFHRLDTKETWTWLGGEPLSLFTLQNNELIEHILNEQNKNVTLSKQVWFGAMLKKDLDNSSTDKPESTADNIPFTLVSCTCTPAFIPQHFHNEINEAMVDVYQQASKENQDRMYLLLTSEQQNDLKEQIALKEKEKKTPNSFAENKYLFLKPDRDNTSESTENSSQRIQVSKSS